MLELNPFSLSTLAFVEVDTAAGVYHLYTHNHSVTNIGARLTYSAGGQQHVLDLVQGATVSRGSEKMGDLNRQLIEIQTQDAQVQATLSLRTSDGEAFHEISAKIEALDEQSEIQLVSVTLFDARFGDTFLASLGRENCRFWRNWHDIWFPTGSKPLEGPQDKSDVESSLAYHFASLYSASDQQGLTFAYQLPNQWLDSIELNDEDQLVAQNGIGVALPFGQPLYSDRLTVSLGPIFTAALPEMHGDHTPRRKVEEARDHFGWNSWEAYQTKVSEADIIENMEELLRHSWLSQRIRYIIIDDGWQSNRTDWFPNEKFPSGMDGLAEKIRSYGFQPGIWTAPFLVNKDSELITQHPEWFIKDGDEILVRNGATCYLDPTHPEARAYIHSIYARLYSWGYRYYKTDFLVEVPMFFVPGRPEYRETARCYDPDLGIMRGMRAAMHTIRAAIGEDSFWLGCGTDIGSGALLMDASRTGGDIAPYWTRVPNQARSVIHHFHLHGQLFLADPDFALLKSSDTFYPEFLDVPLVSPEPYVADAWSGGRCFDADDVRTWASLVILSGGLLNLSDRIKGLNDLGFSILETALEYAGGNAAVPLDVESPIPGILLREESSYYLLGLINWDDAEHMSLTARESLGISFPTSGVLHDVWSGEAVELENGEITVDLAPHKSRLFKWEKEASHE